MENFLKRDKIRLYHGTTKTEREPAVSVRPLVSRGRRFLDFGQGFYLTKYRWQAEQWAVGQASKIAKFDRSAQPVLIEYDFDIVACQLDDDVSFVEFTGYSQEMIKFVAYHRIVEENPDMVTKVQFSKTEFDIVAGPVVDNRREIMQQALREYAQGIRSWQSVGRELKWQGDSYQIAFTSQIAIDRYLKYVSTRRIRR